MKVLLISPKDPQKPTKLKYLMGGENSYTTTLLSHPPKGVEYIHYTDALESKKITYTMWQVILTWCIKLKILPPDAGFQCIQLQEKFDVIHCHVYCLKLDGKIKPPVVLSDSSSNYVFLKNYLRWNEITISIYYIIRKFMVKILSIYDPNFNTQNAPLIVWSEYAAKIHTTLHKLISPIVIPPGVQVDNKKTKEHSSFSILFVGTWFVRKGGLQLLSAYKKLKKKYKNIHVTIVGEIPRNVFIDSKIKHFSYLPHKEILQLMNNSDVLVLTPQKAEGYGLVVLEAAACRLPAIVTNIGALPEIVEHNRTGIVITSSNEKELVQAIEKLIKNKKLLLQFKKNAKELCKKNYSVEVVQKKILKVYKSVLS